jgi:ABC-type transport system substrate-binding protein/tRNA A-37 threonylcarbamoyl transferase component Bud32
MRLDVRTGTVLAGFRVESLLGEGAMGTVFLAEETATGRRVALKLLGPELAQDERFRRRFLRETELAASLDHPHVVPTIASGEEDGTLYLAMAHVEGLDLRKLLRSEGPLEPERALALIEQVADALDAAHAAGLVHRDVKPGNILVAEMPEGEHAYVCDFGLARHISSASSLTVDRGFVGTIDYVPPEQIETGEVDARADVYSLGCVLYESLAGVSPFERESELSVLFAHLNEPPPSLTEIRPDLPIELDAVFATALAKAPDARYQTCGELVRAARAGLHGKVLARRRRVRRRVLLALGVVVIAAGAAVGGIFATRSSHPSSHGAVARRSISLRPSALNLIDAKTRHVVGHVGVGAQVPVADTGWDVAFTKRAAWVLVAAKQRLVRVDLRTRKVTGAVALPWPPGRIAASGESVWVTQDGGPELRQVDARSAKVVRRVTIRGGQSEGGAVFGAGSLWLSSGNGIVRVDPRTGRILHRFPVPGVSTMLIAFADGAVFAARQGNGTVVKIDPVANVVTHRTPLHGWVSDLAVGGGSAWASIVPDGGVYRLGEDDLSVRQTIPAGSDPERISFGGGALWVADAATSSVSRVAQVSGVREALSGRGAQPATAAYHDGLVWVGASPPLPPLPPVTGQELRVVAGGVPYDPAHNGLFDEQVLYATCAKLLNYPDSAGPEGARLRPEIAAAMPTVSPDGRSYTFRIRRGFRFSPPSGEPVTAETFRHTIERQVATTAKDPGLEPYVAGIVGVRAFYAGKARHVAGIAAHGNRLSITLVRPAGDFLTRLAMPRFCPVPLSVPLRGGGDNPIPSAGPYYVASSAGERSVLERNPNYPGDRPRRSARIVFQANVPEAKAIDLADRGAVDMIAASGAGELLSSGGVIDRRSRTSSALARQYHLYQGPIVDYFVFNTRRALFRDARLRRAVDYALDRRELAASFGDAPADRIVPPAVPGYPAGRIFPLSPAVAAARKLAGGRSRHATVYICGDPRERTLAEIVRTDLARIRIAVSVLEDQQCPENPSTAPKPTRADLLLVNGWPFMESDERDPAPVLDQALTSAAYGTPLPSAGWNARSFRPRLDQARPLRGAAREAAYRRLVDEFTRAGPIAVFGSWVWAEYFSPEVGCKVLQGEYGVADLGALCKR